MPLLASNLVSLTVDASLVNALAQTPLVLGNLRELVFDLCEPHVLDGSSMSRLLDAVARVHCPALERVVLLARPDGDGEGAISIEPGMVARLRHVLRRPELQLIVAARCSISAPGSTHPLKVASTVGTAAGPTDVGVPEYYDGCRCTDLFDGSRWDEA